MQWSELQKLNSGKVRVASRDDEHLVLDDRSIRRPSEIVTRKLVSLLDQPRTAVAPRRPR